MRAQDIDMRAQGIYLSALGIDMCAKNIDIRVFDINNDTMTAYKTKIVVKLPLQPTNSDIGSD